jgi:hypothetical protein
MDRTGFIRLLTSLENPATAAAAGKQLNFALKQAGLTWEKVVSANAFLHFVPSAAAAPNLSVPHVAACSELLGPAYVLSAKERDFLESIRSKRRDGGLSEPQARWFCDIAKRNGV